MSPIPEGLTSGVVTTVQPNGSIRLVLVRNGVEAGALDIDPSGAADLAAQILTAARAAQERTLAQERGGKLLPRDKKTLTSWSVAVPSEVGLGPCQIPGHEGLIVCFGQAALGIAVRNDQLHALGQAMLALAAQGTPH